MWDNTGGFGGDFDAGYGGSNSSAAGGGGGGGAGGGGFMNTSTNFGSPSAGAPKKERRNQNIVAVSIKSILEADDESLVMEGIEVNMVTVCGIIRSVDVASSKTTYTIDDHTGIIEVLKYAEDGGDGSEMESLAEGLYARAFGPVRTFQGNKHILSFKVEQLQDPNLITTHILEVIHQKMKLKQLSKSNSGMNASMVGGSTAVLANSSLQNAPGIAGGVGGNSDAELITNAIKSVNSESGVNRQQIVQILNGKLTAETIERTMDHLMNEGLIYSTHDENHFMVIDA